MELVGIDVTLPKEVLHIYEELRDVGADCYIAGGFLMDLYTGHEPNDVDIFITNSVGVARVVERLRSLGIRCKWISGEYEMYEVGERGVSEFLYGGYRIQLVFTSKGERFLEHFDIEMREFRWRDGKGEATKDALRAIERRQISFGIVIDPLKTLRRAIRFEEKYGYTIDEDSLPILLESLHMETYSADIEEFCRAHESYRNRVNSLLKKRDLTVNITAFQILKRDSYTMTKTEFLQLYHKPETLGMEIDHQFPIDDAVRKVEQMLEDIQSLLRENRLKFLMEFPDEAGIWDTYLHNPVYLQTLFKQKVSLLRAGSRNPALENIHQIFEKMDKYAAMMKAVSSMKLRFSTQTAITFPNQRDAYLADELVRIVVDGMGDYVYDRRKKKFISGNVSGSYKVFIDEIVQAYCENLPATPRQAV